MKKFNLYAAQKSAKITVLILLVCSLGQMVSCTAKESKKQAYVKIMSWNLQTFFDGNLDGTEYSQFKSSKNGWNEEKYIQRLNRLEAVLKEKDADILVFEELEKEGQLYDISNRICASFNLKKSYPYGFFAKSEGSAIGCGLLSRFPLGKTSVHSIDIRSENNMQPSVRPVIQTQVCVNEKTLTLFVNHWKSKSGGEKESEIWRKKQESLLARLIYSSNAEAVIACGDFNMDINEFTIRKGSRSNVILKGKHNVAVYSPWILENTELVYPGSYSYKDRWERIDHFFACGSAEITDFKVENGDPLADSEGKPARYKLWTGQGYSDHFPVSCTVRF